MRPGRASRSSERGAELVEFALTLPLLLVVFGGIVDFGLLLQRQQVLSNAVREGARVRVLPGYGEDDARARVTDYVQAGIGETANLVVSTPPPSSLTSGGGQPFGVVTVSASYTSTFLVLGPIVNMAGGTWSLGSSITLNAHSVMRVESVSSGIGP